MVHKVIIIGSGPAGLTAGIYTARAKLEPILFEGKNPGGQLMSTSKVENWPGLTEVIGPKLMMDIREHTKKCGCKLISDVIEKVDFSKIPYKIFTHKGEVFETESVIIATGASYKKLGIPGEDLYWSKGVSVCATCDAPFFKNKDVVVVGGGNSAIMEAEHISHFANKVTIVHILDKLTATDPIKDKVLQNPKIEIIYNATLKSIEGNNQNVTHVVIQHQINKEEFELCVNGVFVAIGLKPNTEIFKDQLEIDKWGYIVKKERTLTNKKGIFVAGDATDFRYRQAIVASGSGCMAALDCQEFLENK